MMERVALSAGRCGSECVEYSKIDHTITSFWSYLTPLLERFLSLCSIIKWVRLCIKY